MASVYETVTGLLLESAAPDTCAAPDDGKVGLLNALPVFQQDFKAFIQEDAADRVLQFLSVREKVVLGTVCKLCHAWVADRWYTADLSGPDVHRQLTWLAQQIPARMLKDLTVRGGPNSLFAQLDVAPSVQPFTALRHLTLQPNGGVTAACIAALSSLQQLTALTTQMGVSNNVQEPVDLVEYAPLTGLQQLSIIFPRGTAHVVLSGKWAAMTRLKSLTISGLTELRQEFGPREGALRHLFQHLTSAHIRVPQGFAELDIASTSLQSLNLDCLGVVPGITSTALPKLLSLSINCGNLYKGLFEGLPVLGTLYMGEKCKANPASIATLSCCSNLRSLYVRNYDCPHSTATFEEFAQLPFLMHLNLSTDHLVSSYSISQQLSKVKHLAHLTLGPPPTAVYRGGLEHLPALRAFAGRGAGAGSADLVSSAVTRLTTCSAHGRCMVRLLGQRAESQEHMRLGSLPKLQLYDIRDLLDLTPALLRDILSLRALRELQVSFCSSTVAGAPINGTGAVRDGGITSLLNNMPALPSLRAARIMAIHTAVGPVNMSCIAGLEHLAIACAELTLRAAGGHDSSMGSLRSLHVIIAEKASPETVAVLRCMDAAPSTVWTGQPYTSKGLQQWKAGRPHAMDLHPRTTTNSKELLFNDGLYI